jgi:hypothetical protein
MKINDENIVSRRIDSFIIISARNKITFSRAKTANRLHNEHSITLITNENIPGTMVSLGKRSEFRCAAQLTIQNNFLQGFELM